MIAAFLAKGWVGLQNNMMRGDGRTDGQATMQGVGRSASRQPRMQGSSTDLDGAGKNAGRPANSTTSTCLLNCSAATAFALQCPPAFPPTLPLSFRVVPAIASFNHDVHVTRAAGPEVGSRAAQKFGHDCADPINGPIALTVSGRAG